MHKSLHYMYFAQFKVFFHPIQAIQRWKTSKDKERQMRIQTQEEMEEAQSKERKVKNLAEQQQWVSVTE